MSRIRQRPALDLNVGNVVLYKTERYTVLSVAYFPDRRLVSVSMQHAGDTALTLRFGADAEVSVIQD